MASNISNGFEQIKGFYSWVFENQNKGVRSIHISLYMFLVNQNNRNRWVEWFKCPYDLAMAGSGISNKNSYYKSLKELQEWGLIKYQPGVNNYKAPLIKIEVLFDTSTVPQSEPQTLPQSIPLTLPLTLPQLANNIKHITDNIELITYNVFDVVDFLKANAKQNQANAKQVQAVNDNVDDDIFVFSTPPDDSYKTIEVLKSEYLKNDKLVQAVCVNTENRISKEIIADRLEAFNLHLSQENTFLKTTSDYASHFRNWHKKTVDILPQATSNNGLKVGDIVKGMRIKFFTEDGRPVFEGNTKRATKIL